MTTGCTSQLPVLWQFKFKPLDFNEKTGPHTTNLLFTHLTGTDLTIENSNGPLSFKQKNVINNICVLARQEKKALKQTPMKITMSNKYKVKPLASEWTFSFANQQTF